MATIDVKISQAVMDSAALDGLAHEEGVFDTAMDAMASAMAKLPTDASTFTSATMTDGTVKVTYPDGTYQLFTGVKIADAGATQGTATATGMTLVTPGAVSVEQTGTFTFNYTTQPSLSIHAASAVADSIVVKTLYATTAADYSAVYGNVSAQLQGHLTVSDDGRVQGSFTSLKLTADKLLASATIDGRFNVADNPDRAAHVDDAVAGAPATMPAAATDNANANANVTVPANGSADGTDHPATMPDAATDNANVTVPASGNASVIDPLKPPVSDMTIDGKATSMDLEFRDGSYVRAGDLGIMFNSGQLDDMLGLVRGALSGDDTIKVDLPAVLPHTVLIASGAGDDKIAVGGGGGKLDVLAGAGNDTITMMSGHHRVDGGTGTDTVVFSGTKAQYTVTQSGGQLTVAGGGGTDVLTNVERLQFSDGAIAYDVDGSAGQAWRMYRAAFDRDPDLPGLGYWIKSLDNNVSLRDLAQYFLNSEEFAGRFGDHLSNAAFVARLYNNVLHRGYDQAGYDYWVDVLEHGEARANVLANFAESTENKVKVMGSIEHGCDFVPYGS